MINRRYALIGQGLPGGVSQTSPSSGDVLVYDGSEWTSTTNLSGTYDVTGTLRLPNSSYLQAENVAGGTFYDLIGLNSSDWIEFGDPSRNIQYDGTLHKFTGDFEVFDGVTKVADFTSAVATFSTTATFGGGVTMTGTLGGGSEALRLNNAIPRIAFVETGVDADDGVWYITANSEELDFSAVNDARTALTHAIRIQRTNTTIDEIELNATTFDFNGNQALAGYLYISDGNLFRVYDSANTDYVQIYHTGSNANISTNVGNIQISDTVQILNGSLFRVYDSTNADYVQLRHNGTDAFLGTFGATAFYIDIGAVGNNQYYWDANGHRMFDGTTLRVYDSTNTDYVQLSHTGANASLTTNAGALQISGGLLTQITGGGTLRIQDSTNTDYLQFFETGTVAVIEPNNNQLQFRMPAASHLTIADNVTVKFHVDLSGETVRVRDGFDLRVYDSADTKYLSLSHDGTTPVIGTGGGENIRFTDDVDLRSGRWVRWLDSGNTDFATFSHDGTDFNTTFTNTTDWNIGDVVVKMAGTLEIGTPPTYTVINLTTDRTYNANVTNLAELADVLGTLIADLRAMGLVN